MSHYLVHIKCFPLDTILFLKRKSSVFNVYGVVMYLRRAMSSFLYFIKPWYLCRLANVLKVLASITSEVRTV